jgi:hypothetical protein
MSDSILKSISLCRWKGVCLIKRTDFIGAMSLL